MIAALIRTTPWVEERYTWAAQMGRELSDQGADLVVAVPDMRTEEERQAEPSGYHTYAKALGLAATWGRGVWLIEDDAVLTSRFVAKAAWAAQCRPGCIIQGYSTDLKPGWRPPATFVNNVCVHIPAPIVRSLYDYACTWQKPAEHRARRSDVMVRSFLVERESRYWHQVPNLATTRSGHFSARLGRRGVRAASRTFEP